MLRSHPLHHTWSAIKPNTFLIPYACLPPHFNTSKEQTVPSFGGAVVKCLKHPHTPPCALPHSGKKTQEASGEPISLHPGCVGHRRASPYDWHTRGAPRLIGWVVLFLIGGTQPYGDGVVFRAVTWPAGNAHCCGQADWL